MSKVKITVVRAFVVTVLLLLAIQFAQGLTIIENDKVRLELQITDAFYADADKDMEADDVIMNFTIALTYEKNKFLVTFYLHLELILPSGLAFDYWFEIQTNKEFLNFTAFYYNHALEPGDYTGIVTVHLPDDDEFVLGTEIIVFDPPGKNDDTDPPAIDLVVE